MKKNILLLLIPLMIVGCKKNINTSSKTSNNSIEPSFNESSSSHSLSDKIESSSTQSIQKDSSGIIEDSENYGEFI